MTNDDDNSTTDADAQPSDPAPSDAGGRPMTDGDPARTDAGDEPTGLEPVFTWESISRKLLLGAIALLALIAAWATLQVYVSTSEAIAIWFSSDYVPIFEAAFNVVVVFVALAGILYLVRELS